MKDFDRLKVRLRQFGGIRLVGAYMRMGLLWPILKALVRCVVKRQSFKSVYAVIVGKVNPILKEKYTPLMLQTIRDLKQREATPAEATEKVRVWWCWLQGLDAAPPLAKACLASLRRNLPDADVIVVDQENYTQWCSLPSHVVSKYKAGRIPPASFSDMLRLQLLATHGGVWIDSTVLCTLNPECPDASGPYQPAWQDIISTPLFVFQYTAPGKLFSGNISNWFIAAHQGHPIVIVLRDMLFAYWQDYDVTLNYYIFHYFFALLANQMPQEVARMPYGWSIPCLELGKHLLERFSQRKWQQHSAQYPWHKLNYRLPEDHTSRPDTYYRHILQAELQGQ